MIDTSLSPVGRTPARASAKPPRRRVVRDVLLCEDCAEDAEIFRRALAAGRIPIELREAEDGEQSLAYLEGALQDAERNPVPDLIFLDLKMPFVGGIEVLRWLRTQRAFDLTCVVVLSSSAEARDVRDAYAAGANGYLTKPPRTSDLQTTLNLVAHHSGSWVGMRLDNFGVGH